MLSGDLSDYNRIFGSLRPLLAGYARMKKGCIISEYPPGTPPNKYYFPQRNRLIAALSDRLYVIDAGRNSGTESTVQYGIKYARQVARMSVFVF